MFLIDSEQISMSQLGETTAEISLDLSTTPADMLVKRYRIILEGTATWADTGGEEITPVQLASIMTKASYDNARLKVEMNGSNLFNQMCYRRQQLFNRDYPQPAPPEKFYFAWHVYTTPPNADPWESRPMGAELAVDPIQVDFDISKIAAYMDSFAGQVKIRAEVVAPIPNQQVKKIKTIYEQNTDFTGDILKVQDTADIVLMNNRNSGVDWSKPSVAGAYKNASLLDIESLYEDNYQKFRYDEARSVVGGALNAYLGVAPMWDRRNHKTFQGKCHIEFADRDADVKIAYSVLRHREIVE